MVPTAKPIARRVIPQQVFDRCGERRMIIARADEFLVFLAHHTLDVAGFLTSPGFNRFTNAGHRRLFRQFDVIERGISGLAMALSWSIQFFIESFFENTRIRRVVRLGTRYTLFWLKYLDYALAKRRGAFDAASGFYFFGRKRENELSDREIVESHVGLRPG
jgi:hypothetical protein